MLNGLQSAFLYKLPDEVSIKVFFQDFLELDILYPGADPIKLFFFANE